MFRSKKEREEQKRKEGRSNKVNWFREGGITSTSAVPTTYIGTVK
jgi:hypothetical protein